MATKSIPQDVREPGIKTGEAFGIRPLGMQEGYNPFLYAWVVNPMRQDKRTGATSSVKPSTYVRELEKWVGLS